MPWTSEADALVLAALNELDTDATPPGALLNGLRERGLTRALEAVASVRAASAMRQWHEASTTLAATQGIEDDLLSTQRALHRAHASLKMLQQQR